MHRTLFLLLLVAAPSVVNAQPGIGACEAGMQRATAVRPTLLAPLAIELTPGSTQLGNSASVLGQAFDEALSLDNVLSRIKLENCEATANAAPASSVVNPNDPAAYKPRTEFDNTPWRFNMNQNGKNMTADEFGAWMKSRGVRVATGAVRDPVVPVAPEVTPMVDEKKN